MQNGKIKVELYVTVDELALIAKALKGKKETIQTADGGEETEGGNK